MTNKPTIIVIREPLLQSILTDAFTVAIAWALILPGHYLGSEAMQWIGAVMFVFTIFSMANQKMKRLTPDEAIARIEAIKAETAA